MREYGIPIENVYRHFDVTGKLCPAYMVEQGAWDAFRKRLREGNMTQEQFDAMMENWLRRQAEQAPAGDSEAARRWAEARGIVVGFGDGAKRYKAFCTREQVVLMLHRLCSEQQIRLEEKSDRSDEETVE